MKLEILFSVISETGKVFKKGAYAKKLTRTIPCEEGVFVGWEGGRGAKD